MVLAPVADALRADPPNFGERSWIPWVLTLRTSMNVHRYLMCDPFED